MPTVLVYVLREIIEQTTNKLQANSPLQVASSHSATHWNHQDLCTLGGSLPELHV